ncbi:hypothetical protein [Enterobacter hormaechei]|uniref:hypothetical protein n=1 Tax=Enterobacter hormaechei TaxID=158836 RepID=UPI001472AE87|nr:hypothetical protein [Enterobacter hormaechei]
MTSDIALSGVACTSGVTPRQLVQSSSENDISAPCFRFELALLLLVACLCGKLALNLG